MPDRAAALLPQLPGVTSLQRDKLSFRFDLAGDERDQAGLLTRLVQDGVAVRRFEEKHATFEAARAAVEKLAASAAKLGWKGRERSGGFKPRPDAFDAAHLPAPTMPPKAQPAAARVAKAGGRK